MMNSCAWSSQFNLCKRYLQILPIAYWAKFKKKSVSMQLACGYLLQYKIVTNMHTNSTLLIPLYDMLKGDTLHFLINCRRCLSSDFIFRGHKWRSKRLLNTKQLLRWYSSCGTPISNIKVDKTQFIPVFVFFKKNRTIANVLTIFALKIVIELNRYI